VESFVARYGAFFCPLTVSSFTCHRFRPAPILHVRGGFPWTRRSPSPDFARSASVSPCSRCFCSREASTGPGWTSWAGLDDIWFSRVFPPLGHFRFFSRRYCGPPPRLTFSPPCIPVRGGRRSRLLPSAGQPLSSIGWALFFARFRQGRWEKLPKEGGGEGSLFSTCRLQFR